MNSIANSVDIQKLSDSFTNNKVQAFVLRLDKFHQVVSGNKWFKLRYYLEEAISKKCDTIITFGGAYSNHIVATAFACKEKKLKCVGIIRGEKPKKLSHTLIAAEDLGMELVFVERSVYKTKQIPEIYHNATTFIIPEGGYGKLGCQGSATIYKDFDLSRYDCIICACGTGTTIAGLIESSLPHQKIIGINALKGYENIVDDIQILLNNKCKKNFEIINNFHFGGYAKYNGSLIEFMNELWQHEQLPTDIVYTSKLFFAVKSMINENKFRPNEKILIIHSGGLQGNLSLSNKTLLF